ncbi:MAG: hypothetical protein IPM54_33090 [Polyangiaceae bacterium]|nr:hypothetical protein [Polyangiaceae bacterium]
MNGKSLSFVHRTIASSNVGIHISIDGVRDMRISSIIERPVTAWFVSQNLYSRCR